MVNNAEGEVLLQKALRFANDEDSVAGEAAKDFANVLAGYMKRGAQYNSGNFEDDALSFLTIASLKLNEMDDDVIVKFIEECTKKNANRIMKRFAEICSSPWFDLSIERLSFLGQHFASAGLKIEGAKCFERAKEKLLEGAGAKPETKN